MSAHTAPHRERIPWIIGLLAIVPIVTGCTGEELKVASGAIEDGNSAFGRTVSEIKLSDAEVSQIADEAGVSTSVVKEVAPSLDSEPVWQQSMTDVHPVAAADDPVSEGLLDIACQGVTGQIQSDQELYDAIVAEFDPRTQDEAVALATDVRGLWQDLYDAYNSDDESKAAAALTCFTVKYIQ